MKSLISRFVLVISLLAFSGYLALFVHSAAAQTVTKKPAPATTAVRTLSAQRLKSLALELMMYTQDNNAYPAMQNSTAVKKALSPYVKGHEASGFLEPGVNKPYLPNPHLSGLRIAQVKAPGDMVAFYEPIAAADGSRLVCTADGRVLTAPGNKWAQIKHLFHLP